MTNQTKQMCACVMCAERADCMPGYDDETLYGGAEEGHVPRTEEECRHHIAGDESTRQKALKERDEFNLYAESLIRGPSMLRALIAKAEGRP